MVVSDRSGEGADHSARPAPGRIGELSGDPAFSGNPDGWAGRRAVKKSLPKRRPTRENPRVGACVALGYTTAPFLGPPGGSHSRSRSAFSNPVFSPEAGK